MVGKILQRCDVCKHFHAWYVVEDAEFGRRYLCTNCWNALYGSTAGKGYKEEKSDPSDPSKEDGPK